MNELQYKNAMPVLPLRDVVLFPRLVVSLYVGRKFSLTALEKAMEDGGQVLLVTQKSPETENPTIDDLYNVGCVANVLQMLRLSDNTMKVLVEGGARAKAVISTSSDGPMSAEVEVLTTEKNMSENEITAASRALKEQIKQYAKASKKIGEDILGKMNGLEDLERLADLVSHHFPMKLSRRQEFLEMTSLSKRINELFAHINQETETQKIERKIRGRVKDQIEKNQREYYLQEQARAIHRELGDDQGAEMNDLKKAIKESGMPKQARQKCEQEFKKLKMMSPMSAESTVTRSYLDIVLSLPWKKRSTVNADMNLAREVMDVDHYGLVKMKERVLEHLAVQKRVPNGKAPILCFVGPPGVGKTSLGRSIASATGRVFSRISLGGVRDEAEIRGHRRTYVGSMPGKIINAMIRSKVKNPIILLDEIDKMGYDFRGDPSSALLEVLDPEQNNTFSDHYVELEYDLSEVMFVTTANTMNIPPALLDRLEIIRLSGYTEDEKINIAQRHLLPRQYKENGIKKNEASFSPSSLVDIVRYYTREAGVRQLERNISKICRKIVLNAERNAKQKKSAGKKLVTPKSLVKYLSVRKYRYGVAAEENKIGEVTGLAWTESGGELLSVEAGKYPGCGKITRTGKLGEVMRESIETAFSTVRSRASGFNVKPDFLKHHDFHIHLPEGAIPKDGPSAGIAIATAVLSVLSGISVRANVAMTGEITLHGEVLPIGGLKEKMLAAARGGIKHIILPAENEKDLVEIEASIKNNFEIHFVKWVDEVFELALEVPVSKTKKTATKATKRSRISPPAGGKNQPQITH